MLYYLCYFVTTLVKCLRERNKIRIISEFVINMFVLNTKAND